MLANCLVIIFHNFNSTLLVMKLKKKLKNSALQTHFPTKNAHSSLHSLLLQGAYLFWYEQMVGEIFYNLQFNKQMCQMFRFSVESHIVGSGTYDSIYHCLYSNIQI